MTGEVINAKRAAPVHKSSHFARGPEVGRTTWGLCMQPFSVILARGCFHDLNPWPLINAKRRNNIIDG
jgi:hypothetical protein